MILNWFNLLVPVFVTFFIVKLMFLIKCTIYYLRILRTILCAMNSNREHVLKRRGEKNQFEVTPAVCTQIDVRNQYASDDNPCSRDPCQNERVEIVPD